MSEWLHVHNEQNSMLSIQHKSHSSIWIKVVEFGEETIEPFKFCGPALQIHSSAIRRRSNQWQHGFEKNPVRKLHFPQDQGTVSISRYRLTAYSE